MLRYCKERTLRCTATAPTREGAAAKKSRGVSFSTNYNVFGIRSDARPGQQTVLLYTPAIILHGDYRSPESHMKVVLLVEPLQHDVLVRRGLGCSLAALTCIYHRGDQAVFQGIPATDGAIKWWLLNMEASGAHPCTATDTRC